MKLPHYNKQYTSHMQSQWHVFMDILYIGVKLKKVNKL